MNIILVLSLIMILITLGVAYLTYNLANSEEAEIIMKFKSNIQIA